MASLSVGWVGKGDGDENTRVLRNGSVTDGRGGECGMNGGEIPLPGCSWTIGDVEECAPKNCFRMWGEYGFGVLFTRKVV